MIPNSLSRPRWLAVLVVAALLACTSAATAQEPPGLEDPIDPQVSSTWFTLPVKTGIFVASLIVAWAFGFYAIFPWLLDRKNAIRPRQAYGLSAGLIWVAWCGAALLVFQDMMVLKAASNDFVRDWLLTCLICLAALVGFTSLRMIFGGRGAGARS